VIPRADHNRQALASPQGCSSATEAKAAELPRSHLGYVYFNLPVVCVVFYRFWVGVCVVVIFGDGLCSQLAQAEEVHPRWQADRRMISTHEAP